MTRSRARMLFRLALVAALPLTLSAADERAPEQPPTAAGRPALLTSDSATPIPAPPRLLELPHDVIPVALDFVPPVPEMGEMPQPAARPDTNRPADLSRSQSVPLEVNERGLWGQAAPPAAESAPLRRLPAVTESPAPWKPDASARGISSERLPTVTETAPPWKSDVSARGISNERLPAVATLPERTAPLPPPVTPPPSATPSPLLEVNRQAQGLIRHGSILADRGAYYSARAQFIQALRLVTQALDVQNGTSDHSQALAEGLRALQEADDFSPRGSQLEANLDLASIVTVHRTPVLKDERMEDLSPLTALQRYYAFAQNRLDTACGQQPAASEALYSLGKLTTVLAQRSPDERRLHAPKAMALHHAALAANPANHRAAHELGVLFASFGQFDEAKRLLVQSASLAPLPETWQNLATIHDRLGEKDLAQKARNEMRLASQSRPAAAAPGAVQWLDATAFARTTPQSNIGVATPPRAASVPQKSLWK